MKLLPKSELTQAYNLERKLEIDQGLALARKVDRMRQTAAEEELNLAKFRAGTGRVLLEEVNDLIRKRDALRDEIEAMRRKKELESNSLNEERYALKARRDEIMLKEDFLSLKSLDLEQKEAEIGEISNKTAERESELKNLIIIIEERDRKSGERESKLSAYKQKLTEGIHKLG